MTPHHIDPKAYRREYNAKLYQDPEYRKKKLEYLKQYREMRKQKEAKWTIKRF